MQRTASILPVLALALLAGSGARAAELVIVNFDEPGVGFNDPTPVARVGGNKGKTLGEQRWIVFNYAARLWGSQLKSSQPIYVGAVFGPLDCDATSAVLGAAGPNSVFASYPGLPRADTWYVGALADAITGEDLDPGYVDIVAWFNGDIGVNPRCLTGQTWYNGLDNNNDPASEIDLLAVVMHEMGHGLGFLDLASEGTGELFYGLPDAYLVNLYDTDLGLGWANMTNRQRLASQVNTDKLVWTGPRVTAKSRGVLGPRPSVIVREPDSIKGSYEAQAASFGPPLSTRTGTTGHFKIARDGVGDGTDGCEPIVNNVRNRIAIIDRGTCAFSVKVANAQAAGAKAVIVVNNAPTGRPPMGGSDPAITIPAVGVSMADGAAFKAASYNLAVGKLKLDRTYKAGTTDGYVRLYAPNPAEPGSSKSHWDVTATPNLLMEPFINDDLVPLMSLDLTPKLLQDIGWQLQ